MGLNNSRTKYTLEKEKPAITALRSFFENFGFLFLLSHKKYNKIRNSNKNRQKRPDFVTNILPSAIYTYILLGYMSQKLIVLS